MSKTRIAIISISVLLIAGITLLVLFVKPDYDWAQRFDIHNDQPFDLSFTKTILENSGSLTVLEDSLILPENGKGSLIWIRNDIELSDTDADRMLDFINAGGKVFMAAEYFPFQIIDTLQTPIDTVIQEMEEDYYFPDESLKVDRYISDKACYYISNQPDEACLKGVSNGKFRSRGWKYFDMSEFNSDLEWSTVAWLETDSRDQPVILDFPIGKGTLTLSSAPLLLTNYYMADSLVFDLNSTLFSSLSQENMHLSVVPNPSFIPYDKPNVSKSPLSFVLDQKSLRAAWFVLVGTALLFLLFSSRRKQGTIGYWKNKQNTSLVYSDQIASLYRDGTNLGEMGKSEVRWFLYRLKERYKISIKPKDISRASSIDLIAEVTGADRGDVAVLTAKLDQARNYVRSLDELKALSLEASIFYKTYI